MYFVGVRNVIAIRQQHFGKPFAAVGVRFIVPAYTYSQRIRNPFRIHSRNVRHAFAIRSEYIHVMFATHFVGGRCIINNPFATFWQSVRSVMANRSQP